MKPDIPQRRGDLCLLHGRRVHFGCQACTDYRTADQIIAGLDDMHPEDLVDLRVEIDGPGGWPAMGRLADAVNAHVESLRSFEESG